jgi:hypothetical protein
MTPDRVDRITAYHRAYAVILRAPTEVSLLSVIRVLGVVGAIVLVPILAFDIWLLATPDYDGGRHAVGGMIVAAAELVVVLYGIVYAVARVRRRAPRLL